MTRRQKYFLKQRLIGLAMIIGSILITYLFRHVEGSGTIMIILIPMGLVCLFSKDMVITDKYFFEVREKKERRESN